MSTTVIAILRPFKIIKSQVLFFPKTEIKINWKKGCFLIGIISIVLMTFYVFQLQSLISIHYQLEITKKEINELLEEKGLLEITLAENSFWKTVKEKIEKLNFQKTSNVKYIRILENYFAILPKN